MPLGDAEYHSVAYSSRVEFRGADQIADVLQYNQVCVVDGDVVQTLAGHLGVQVAHTASMQLYGLYSCGLADLDGIHIAVDVGFHYRYTDLILYEIDEPD